MWYSVLGINDYFGHQQHWWAFQERRVSLGEIAPFPQCHEYDSFTITSITDNGDGSVTLVDSSKTWTFLISGVPHNRWTEATPGSNGIPEWADTSYDVVLDADRSAQPGLSQPDPATVFQAGPIFDQPTAASVKLTFNLAKYCSELSITVASLVGRTGWILRNDGDNWTRGPLPWPNAPHWTTGVVTASAAGTLTSDREIDHPVAIVGQEVVYLAGGKMQRGTITSVTPATNSMTFTGTTANAVVDQSFYVIPPGGYFQFGRTAGTAQRAFAGLTTPYYAHDYPATDGTTSVGKPRQTYPVLYGENSGSCPIGPTDETLYVGPDGLDVDYYVGFMNVCADGDYFLAPDWWQCYRHLWCGILRLASSFEPYGAADGSPAEVPTFSIALFLYTAGINPHSATAGTHSGTTLPVALGVSDENIWWSVLNSSGVPILDGYERNYNGSTINGDFSAVHDGKTVVASTGPTRVVERAIDALYDVTYFVPDLDDGSPVVPPTEAFPGTWTTIPKATTYLRADLATGQISRGTFARDNFANGHVARWVGHRKKDPGFPLILPADVPDALAAYHNNAYVGRRTEAVQSRIDASRAGVATGGSSRRLVVLERDFDNVDFYAASNGLTHTFAPDDVAGDRVSCQVTGETIGALWADARFPGFAGGPLSGFTVEFITNPDDLDDPTNFDDPAAVVDKRLITSGTSAGFITWDEPAAITGRPNSARIVEPLVLNPLKERPLFLRNPGGATATVVIEGSHGDTLFIPDPGGGFVVGAGTRFRIGGPQVKDTVMRVGGQWVTTADAGADARYAATDFQPTAESNQPDKVIEHGLPHAMDVTFHGPDPIGCVEIQTALATLKEFPVSWGWDSPANNNRDASWHNETTNYGDWASHVISGDGSGNPAYYNHHTNTASGAPFAHWLASGTFTPWDGSTWQTGPGWSGRVNRQFNRAIAHPPRTPFAKSILFYDKAERFGSTSSSPAPSPSVATGAFDANNDPVAEGVYTWWSSKSSTTAADVPSDDLGSLAAPNDAGAPGKGELPAGAFFGDSGSVSHRAGYTVTDVWVACRPTFVFG